jgi:hypothetical protein
MWYVTIEPSGGFGNQMFMVAAMLGYADLYGHTPVFLKLVDGSNDHPTSVCKVSELFSNISIRPELSDLPWQTIQEAPGNAFTYRSLPDIQGHVRLKGYFQSERYFPKQGISVSLYPPMFSCISYMKCDWPNTFFLHIRRGDYLHPLNTHHNISLLPYMRKCLTEYDSERHTCFVVSDDIEWCRRELPFLIPEWSKWMFCSSECSDLETLFWMQLCMQGGICANSSFSWWSAYFLHKKEPIVRIFMPAQWGTPPLPPARDLHPSWARKVELISDI